MIQFDWFQVYDRQDLGFRTDKIDVGANAVQSPSWCCPGPALATTDPLSYRGRDLSSPFGRLLQDTMDPSRMPDLHILLLLENIHYDDDELSEFMEVTKI